ncbi:MULTISPECIES: hypothetical protein [unclassified Nitratiruptor]|uniref:hypothetical protein n=1 Tax=unclassified Nitratiruptor TaxID=2624044 RepID=UPI001914F351|nr:MULTISPECIES: hypothetical protein [unclassified Nitratiruptor]BCD59613.1 hypothetical protein NitYY0810_C0364 [Nitratiruptor sp. YY08-10]BCD63537.1 hypothetical protein NitYY0814_C0364 [Nitratiruptor sp. YY08-14]BCD83089.1 hypothetical protein NrS2_39 [Nitratiruptor phage NrS-2]BCD83155.1 hypothetical protein NrS3_39 [Nitratiruptor phage NrS-3]
MEKNIDLKKVKDEVVPLEKTAAIASYQICTWLIDVLKAKGILEQDEIIGALNDMIKLNEKAYNEDNARIVNHRVAEILKIELQRQS